MTIDPALEAAIAAFRLSPAARRGERAYSATNWCRGTTTEFIEFLRDRGIAADLVWLAGAPPSPNAERFWRDQDPATWVHYVAAVGEILVDWTARQFDPRAHHPAIGGVGDRFGWTSAVNLSTRDRGGANSLAG